MEEGDGDAVSGMRDAAPPWPRVRTRSRSHTFGFRSRVLCRLRLARSGKNPKTGSSLSVGTQRPFLLKPPSEGEEMR